MAQFVRRPETMDHESQGDKTRTSYFCNMKNRLGSRLPAGVSQPPQFAQPPWKTHVFSQMSQAASAESRLLIQPVLSRPLHHTPHIRNPMLRQYYLQGSSPELHTTSDQKECLDRPADVPTSCRGPSGDTAFNITSKLIGDAPPSEHSALASSCTQTQHDSLATLITKEMAAKGKNKRSNRGFQPEPDFDSGLHEKPEGSPDYDCFVTLTGQPHSPSPEEDYDKLLDVEEVPLPDGQSCLLALPPELCQGLGPEPMSYLKLFCRHITDRKGVVAGILLVTSNKIFFDPLKKHPLVKEHGCEEYLLSYSVDSLASVTLFSDISRVHFNTSSHQRKKEKTIVQRLKKVKRQLRSAPNKSAAKSYPAPVSVCSSDSPNLTQNSMKNASEEEAERGNITEAEPEPSVGGLAVLSSAATFCCGAEEETSKVKRELQETQCQAAVPHHTATESHGGLMFVRLRIQPCVEKPKCLGSLQSGSTKTSTRKDAWLALSQESSDELHAYLKRCRPDLCVLDGEEETEADRDEEGFVLIEGEEDEDDEEDEGEMQERRSSSGDDWEMVLKMEGNKDKLIMTNERDSDGFCVVAEKSQILDVTHVKQLSKELPPRTVGYSWQLAFSTSRHGASLKSLYRKLRGIDSPVLIVIKDALDEVFGAFLSHPLRPSETFYGTGETFLFMLHPRFKCFRWTGENSFFIKGDLDCFVVGGGSGHFGLWVDENLYLGRSSPCYTFNNCCLSETDDFRIMELEVWTFS